MANEPTFTARRTYERRLPNDGTLQRRAIALIVIGLAFVAAGGANLDLFDATVGVISVGAGGIWLWFLT
jgi:hypothetical protein